MPLLKRIASRISYETGAFFTGVKDLIFDALPQHYKYQRGTISMAASIANMRRNGFHPSAIIEVGAFEGDWSRMARQVYPDAPIYMFDANPEKEPLLAGTIREIAGAQFRISLLGAEPAESVLFHVMGTGSSVLSENTSLPRSTTELPMTTLDNLWLADKQRPGPYFLKLDVQGFELEVLRGAEQVLENTEAAMLEVSLLPYNQGAPLLGEVVAFMLARGFVVYDVAGLYRRESDGALYRIVLLFVRESNALRSKKRFWNREAEFDTEPALR